MYKLLIVDDEILELETLRDYIDWNSLDISVAATAKNGRDALSKAAECKPDIIITDIKMPIMDGIEFTKQLRQFNKTSKLIFLTGYDDFSYVKSALNVNAFDYILKPFSTTELYDVINRVKATLEKDILKQNSIKLFIENRFHRLLNYNEEAVIQETIMELKKLVDHDFNSFTYNLLLINCSSDSMAECIDSIYSLDSNAQIIKIDSLFAVIINASLSKTLEIKQVLSKIQNNILEKTNSAAIIYSEAELKLEDLGIYYRKLILFKDLLFYYGKKCIINISEIQVQNFNDLPMPSIENKLTEAIFSYEKIKVEEVINDYFQYITENKILKATVLEGVFSLLLYLWDNFLKHNPQINLDSINRNEIWNELIACEDIDDVRLLTVNHIEKITEYIIEKQKDKNQHVVDKVIKFIEINFGNPITISDVAKEIYLSPNYIRNIFKEKTGVTFLEYLTSFRMKKASEFLKDKSLRVHDVSNMVGYENVSYFCSVFTKTFGVSPNEYRNKY
jgi:two-component system response regulator YesN